MSLLLGAAAALAFPWALLRLVSLPRGLRLAASLLAAPALWSASSTVALFSGVPAVAIDGGFLVAALAVAVSTSARRPWLLEAGAAPRWALPAFAAACALAAAALVSHLVRFPDGGNDAFIIWNLRARWLFRAGAGFRSAFSPEILFWAHPDYPLLLPALVARGFSALGRESALVPAAAALFFTGGAIAVTCAGAPPARRWCCGLALATTPALVMLGATEQADLPVAAFLGAAVAILVSRAAQDEGALAAAGAFASMAAWTKNEGVLALVLLAAAVLLDERRLRSAGAFLAGALPLFALLAVFKLGFAPPNDLWQTTASAAARRALDLGRLWTLALLVARRIVLFQAWGLHLLALTAWFVFARRWSAPPPRLRWLSWTPAAALALHLCILLAQPHDLTFMFKVTIDRLLFQWWPALLLLLFARVPRDLALARTRSSGAAPLQSPPAPPS